MPVAAALVIGAPYLVVFAFREREAMVAQVGLSTATLFATLLALLAGAGAVVRDRESGIRDLLLARPLPPSAWLLGKWVGITAAVFLAVSVLGGIHLAALGLRGGPAKGYGPICAALASSLVQGGLAAAAALLFSSIVRAGPAFLAALVLLLLGHVAALIPAGAAADSLRFLLPRFPHLNLSGEAAFGSLPASLWTLAILHGALYSFFLLALGARLAARRGGP